MQKSLKFALKMQLAFTGVFKHMFCDFSCFCKSAGEDMAVRKKRNRKIVFGIVTGTSR